MRDTFSSLLSSRAGKLALTLLFASPHIIPGASAFTFQSVPSPNLDLSELGRIAFAGDFDSISLYEYEGQTEGSYSRNGALLSRFPNNVFATLNETDADIKTMCAYTENGTYKGVVFGGNFTSVGRQHTPGGIALLNTDDGTVTPLEGLNGSVNALYCDTDYEGGRVYVGGSFTGGNSANALLYTSGTWENMPFSGFNGPVNSIVKSNGKIIFGGRFNGLGANTTTPARNNTQVLPIGSASLSTQTSSGRPGLTEPQNIVCKSDAATQGFNATWLLADNSPGFWRADFGFGFTPTMLRLHNTDFEGRGTRTWRYTALPDGGIMNLTYVDASGQRSYCDARCPLPEGDTSAQDFQFVNNVGMNAFRIDISEWYGQGGGLDGIELFQNDIYTFAINEYNEPKCGGVTTGATSTLTPDPKSSGTAAWIATPSHDSNSGYLTATLDRNAANLSTAYSVQFQPDIKQSGQYQVLMYTPGCLGDNTCQTRGSVTIEGQYSSSGAKSQATTLFQTNDFDKYDEIYTGYIDATDGFRPSVTLRPSGNQLNQRTNVLTVVAQRVRFILANATADGLNGVFEYDPNQQVVEADFGKSVINSAGANLNPENQAIITSVASADNKLFIAGNFSGDGFNNIFTVNNGASNASSLEGAGLNDQVMIMYVNGSDVYVGGNFTNTQNNGTPGLNGVAMYSGNQWRALGAGVNGVVMYIIPFTMNLTTNVPESVLGISGFFDRVNSFNGNAAYSVQNFAVWVPSRQNWLDNLNIGAMSMHGSLTAYSNIPNAAPMFAGRMASQSLGASGAVALNSRASLSLESLPIAIRPQQEQTSLQKRALTDVQDLTATGIVAAAFYKENGLNKTIMGGHFSATGADGQNITNLLIIDGNDSNRVSGLGDGDIDTNSTFGALSVLDNILFAGGAVSGSVSNNRIGGILAYDLSSNNLASSQPPALQGTNVTVNAISRRPNSPVVFVGGRFQSAGGLSCQALCIWDTQRNQWTSPGGDLSGVVTSLFWLSDNRLLVAGNLTNGGNSTTIVTYDTSNSRFQDFSGARDLPGPVTALCPADNSGDQVWATGRTGDGSAYLQKFNGNQWQAANVTFLEGTVIRGLQILPLSRNHGPSGVLTQSQDLLILGSINVTDFGTASGVLYNGTDLIPFLLSANRNNDAGSMSQVLVENAEFIFSTPKKRLALGFIVLIALGIALGLTFLLVVAGILLEWYRKKAKGYSPAPTVYPDRSLQTSRIPPEHLFGTLQGNRAPAI